MKNIKLLVVAFAVLVTLACNTVTTAVQDVVDALEEVEQFTDSPTEAPVNPEVFETGDPPSDETLLVLKNTIVPENNPIELADRLKGIEDVPDTIPAPAQHHQVGDRRSFWVTDTDIPETFSHDAVLRYVSDELYFWIEDGVDYHEQDLIDLARAFEDHMVPTNRAFFGSEWNPGVDNDPHIYILYTSGLGSSVAGYFSSSDAIHPDASPGEKSNAAEMFVLADSQHLRDEYTYGVLAHEFQHMIHWNTDRNETSWINEGLSELATLLNGYYHPGFIYEYLDQPDLQLNDWPESNTQPHYGAGFLFVTYFLERFGEDATKALVADPANGLESVDFVLSELGETDPATGTVLTADDVVLDWVIANYLADPNLADGRYGYPNYPELTDDPAQETETVDTCSAGMTTRQVHQFGVDYIRLACDGQVTLQFEGATRTDLLPIDPYSGSYAFWSNKGDESDMTLTRSFDFTDVEGEITLSYQTWYHIEEDWDYVYVLASTNGGDDWDFLDTPSGTGTNPTGNSFGWGYTGFSGHNSPGRWIEESVDLSPYAGQEVLIRFEYITDAAVNGEGLMVDDIAIAETGYFEDFETGDGGWLPDGFARVQNELPQTFRLALILHGDGDRVEYLTMPLDNQVELALDFDASDEVTLVVMGSTRFTRQTAAYRFAFEQQ
jgi:immune inhibitor A